LNNIFTAQAEEKVLRHSLPTTKKKRKCQTWWPKVSWWII